MGIKVTRDMLDRYRKLKQEIPVLELELLMMKNTEVGLGNDTIFDYQTGYPRPQSVVGFDQKKYDRREKILERKKEKVKAMDQWIDDIKDGQTRCVFRMHYILENGTDIQESDGICLFVGKDAVPDYRIISIKPYRMLSLEVEKL